MADFYEPDGEFELDFGRIDELTVGLGQAEQRWQANPEHRTVGVLDDPGSALSRWWSDPVHGPQAIAARAAAAARLKSRLNAVFRPLAVCALLWFGAATPARAARWSSTAGLLVHTTLPAARLGAAGARWQSRRLGAAFTSARRAVARRCGREPAPSSSSSPPPPRHPGELPYPDATMLMPAGHLLAACTALPLMPILWRGGAPIEALLLGGLGRLAMLPGLWHWRDLDAELRMGGGGPAGLRSLLPRSALRDAAGSGYHLPVRAWRLAATALCLAEAASLFRVMLALDAALGPRWASGALGASGSLGASAAATAALCSLPGRLGAAGGAMLGAGGMLAPPPCLAAALPLPSLALPALPALPALLALPLLLLPLLPARLLAAATLARLCATALAGGASLAPATALWVGRLGSALLLASAASWAAFVTDAGTRTAWSPQLAPHEQPPLRTPASALLGVLGLARGAPSLVELRRLLANDAVKPSRSRFGARRRTEGESGAGGGTGVDEGVGDADTDADEEADDLRRYLWSRGPEHILTGDGGSVAAAEPWAFKELLRLLEQAQSGHS